MRDIRAKSGLNDLLSNMEAELHVDEFVYCTVPREQRDQLQVDAICSFREAEGDTLIIRRKEAERSPSLHIPMQSEGGSKRNARPAILTVSEFCKLLGLIAEPYKTMVIVAQCLGLRASEIVGLQWDDFDFKTMSVLIERGVVHGRVGDARTENSRDRVPIDSLLAEVLAQHRIKSGGEGSLWVFENPQTSKPYHQESIQKTHIRDAGEKAGLAFPVGWHTFRHTYRSLLDASGAPMTVQRQLMMRHASIQTTMNVYGQAMPEGRRQANSKVVEMVLSAQKTSGTEADSPSLRSA